MATVTLELPDETRRRLEDKAAQKNQSFDAYVRGLLEADADQLNGVPQTTDEKLSPDQRVEEFDRWLAELESLPPIPPPARRLSDEEYKRWQAELRDRKLPSLPPLPGNFSREDIYFDHD